MQPLSWWSAEVSLIFYFLKTIAEKNFDICDYHDHTQKYLPLIDDPIKKAFYEKNGIRVSSFCLNLCLRSSHIASLSLCGWLILNNLSQSSLMWTRNSLSWSAHTNKRTGTFQKNKGISNACFTDKGRLLYQKLTASNSSLMKSWTHFTCFRYSQLHSGLLINTNGSQFL